MGVDVNKRKPPHWIQDYYISKAKPPMGGKYPDGFICSCCGKKSCNKKEVCDGCGSVMVNSKKILSDLQKVEDVVEVVRCKDCDVPHNRWTGCPYMNGLVPPADHFCSYGERKEKQDVD